MVVPVPQLCGLVRHISIRRTWIYSRRSMGAAPTSRKQWRRAALLAVGGVILLTAGLPSIIAGSTRVPVAQHHRPGETTATSPLNTGSTTSPPTATTTTPTVPSTATTVPPTPPAVTSTPATPTPASAEDGGAASADAPASGVSPAAASTPTSTTGSATPLAYISATTGLLSALASLIVAAVALKARQPAANDPGPTQRRSATKRRRK